MVINFTNIILAIQIFEPILSTVNTVYCTHKHRAHTVSLLKWFHFVFNISANKHQWTYMILVSNDWELSNLFLFLNGYWFNQPLSSKCLPLYPQVKWLKSEHDNRKSKYGKRNLRGDVQRSGGTPVGGHSRLFEGTPLNMLIDFTNNDFSCRAIDLKKITPMYLNIKYFFKNPYGNLALDFRPMPSILCVEIWCMAKVVPGTQ